MINWGNILREAFCFYAIGFGVLFLIEVDVRTLGRSLLDAAIWPLRVLLGAWDLVDELREGWPGWEGEARRDREKKESKP